MKQSSKKSLRFRKLVAKSTYAVVGLAVVLASLPLVMALTSVGVAQEQQAPLAPGYLVGAGDTLTVIVRNEPELSRTAIVRPDGRISLPLVQDIIAAGRTPDDLARDIERSLAVYLRDPIVTVAVSSAVGLLSEQIRIVGEVVTPTAIPFRAGMTLLDAIQATGGLSPEANGNRAKLIRKSEGTSEQIPIRLGDLVKRGDVGANIALAPGDIIVVPEGFFSGTVEISRALAAQVELSDNIDLDPEGQEETGTVLSAGPVIGVRGNYARLTAALDTTLALKQVSAGDDKGLRLDPSISGFATAELVRDRFFVDAAASIRRQLLDTSEDADSEQELVQVYSASPYLVNRFGSFASSETRYRFTQVLESGDDVGDSQRHEGILTVNSGSQFTRFDWTFLARAFTELEDGDDDADGWLVDLGVEYPVVRTLSLLGTVGYEQLEDGDTDINGITWRGGFRWRPTPRFDMELTYGRRDDDESFAGSVNYDVTPRTRLFARYEETLETEIDELAADLGNIGTDPISGDLINLDTGLPFDPSTTSTTVRDNLTRNERFTGGVVSTIGLNTFQVVGSFEQEEDEATAQNGEETITADVRWTRPLSTRLTSIVSVRFENNQFEIDDTEDTEYQVQGGLNYQISDRLASSFRYSYRMQESDVRQDEFKENRIVVGIVGSF